MKREIFVTLISFLIIVLVFADFVLSIPINWTAIGAIAQVAAAGALFFAFYQIKQFRIEGFREAIDVLNENRHFKQVALSILEGEKVSSVDWKPLLEQINLVALLVSEGFTDDKLLFVHKGKQLSAISKVLKTDRISDNERKELRQEYPNAIKLLGDSEIWQAGQDKKNSKILSEHRI